MIASLENKSKIFFKRALYCKLFYKYNNDNLKAVITSNLEMINEQILWKMLKQKKTLFASIS